MSWHVIFSYKGQVFHDEARLVVAHAALTRHFTAAGCTAYQAAQAAFTQERPDTFAESGEGGDGLDLVDDRSDVGDDDDDDDWAEAWRCASDAVASALGLNEADVDVELQHEPRFR